MTDLSRSTVRAIAETSRMLIDNRNWRFASHEVLRTLEAIELNLEETEAPWWNIVLAHQGRSLADLALTAFDNGDLDLAGVDGSMLMDPDAYEASNCDKAPQGMASAFLKRPRPTKQYVAL